MTQNFANTISDNLQTMFQLNNQGADHENIHGAGELNFAEHYVLFKIECEQFLADTNNEKAKCAQRLLELESIVYGSSASR